MAAQEEAAPAPVADEFVLRRNCSLSPRALMGVFGSVAALSFAFGVGFAALGAWMVLPFAGVELLALTAAFLVYGAHATDGEKVRLSDGLVVVEVINGNAVQVHEFPAWQVRLIAEDGPGNLWSGRMATRRLYLACGNRRLEVGRHLGVQRRVAMEGDLRAALADHRRRGSCRIY